MSSIWDIIRVPFGYLLEWLYMITTNYGIALILFALIVKLILLPMSAKGRKSMMKISRVAPRTKELQDRYGDDKQAYQTALAAMYREEGISATGGCLWSFIPLLVLIPLYQVIRQPIVYMMHLSPEEAKQIVNFLLDMGLDLGRREYYRELVAINYVHEYADQIRQAIPALKDTVFNAMNFEFLGLNLSLVPQWKAWKFTSAKDVGMFFVPVVSAGFNLLTMWLSQKLNSTVTRDKYGEKDKDAAAMAAQNMKGMMYMMPILSLWIGYSMPAAISIYWIAQGAFGILQDVLLTKHYGKVYDKEDAVKRARVAERERHEAEKAAEREKLREQSPDGIITANTSKKKLQQKQKNEAKAAARAYEAKKSGKKNGEEPLSGDPRRPNSRGRAYQADRYSEEVQPAADAAKEAAQTENAPPEEA